MRRMDSEMVMEVPDTPERLLFTRSVGQSSSRACGIEGKPSSSNQYSETTARNYSYQMKNCDLYDLSGNNVSVDGDKSSHSKINQFISGTHDIRTIHVPDSSPKLVLSGILNDNGTHPEMIDLSQENPSPTSYPTRNMVPNHKEEKHVSRYNDVIEISGYGKLGDHDLNRKNATSVDDDFLFSQAKVARVISSTLDTEVTHSHKNVPELLRSSVFNSGTNPEVIDLSQGSPSPLPYPIRHKGPRYKEEKYLSSQSERNEINGYGKLGMRALSSIDSLEKEKNNSNNSSKVFGSFNNITKAENIRCRSGLVPRQKDKVIVQQLNSRTRNELLQSRHPELSFSQSIAQAMSDCKELKNPSNQRAPSSRVRNQGTEIGNGSDKVSQSTTVETNHNHLDVVLHPKKNGHRMLVRNGCISPSNIAKTKNDRNTKCIEDGGSIASEMPITNSSQSTQLDVVLHPESSRILVNNGCISPSHIAGNNNDANARGFEGGVIVSNDNPSSFEGRTIDTRKGKEVMNEELLGNPQHIGIIPSSRRSCLSPGQELTISSKLEQGPSRSNGCGAVHQHAECSSLIPSSITRHSLSIANKPEVATLQSGENITQVHGCLKLALEAPQHTGKRKKDFAHSNSGECSSSSVSSRISYDRRSAKPSNSRSIRSRKSVRVDTAVVEINELDSTTKAKNHVLSNESIARSKQLESDEVLARQLQEQFYLELPPVATEVESTLEWSFVQEDDDLYTSSRRRNQYLQREALLPSLLGRRRSHQPSTRMISHTQQANAIERIMRDISNSDMSLEERLTFLEAFEEEFEHVNEMGIADHFLVGQRDFNENDYEMLVALDDNNHHVGASERQINNLPQSVIQSTDSGETCAICLETPSVGDTIRHLPCLHKFHKNCIDTWLRRKRSCPICKHGIT